MDPLTPSTLTVTSAPKTNSFVYRNLIDTVLRSEELKNIFFTSLPLIFLDSTKCS